MFTLEEFNRYTQKGDLLVVANTAFDPIGSFIRWWTGSEYSHVMFVVGVNDVIDVPWDGVKQIKWEGSVYSKSYKVKILRPCVTDEQKEKAVQFALTKVGKRYDYCYLCAAAVLLVLNKLGLDRNVRNWFDMDKAYTCIELPVDSYFETSQIRLIKSDINRSQATPDDLVKHGINMEVVGDFGV